MKDGEVRRASAKLREANRMAQTGGRFILTKESRELVRRGILEEAERLGQDVYAMAIRPTHVHLVLGVTDGLIETAVARYKRAGTKALREIGFEGKVWTKGYDKRFCFDEEALRQRIAYVKGHEGT